MSDSKGPDIGSKTANNVYDYNLPLDIKSIAFILKAKNFDSCTDCLTMILACLNGHGRRNRCNIAPLRQIARAISIWTLIRPASTFQCTNSLGGPALRDDVTSYILHQVCKNPVVSDNSFSKIRRMVKNETKLKLMCFMYGLLQAPCKMVKYFSTLIQRNATWQKV